MADNRWIAYGDYCENCRRFVAVDEYIHDDPSGWYGHSDSYFCRECGGDNFKSVPFFFFEMFTRQEITLDFEAHP